jgi:adenylate cyclase
VRHNPRVPFVLDKLYKRLGSSYFALYLAFDVVSASTITLGTIGLFSLYEPVSAREFLQVFLVSEVCVAIALAYSFWTARRVARPLIDWIRAGRPGETALEAWRTAAGLPRDFIACNGWKPFAIVALPISVYATVAFDLPLYSAGAILAGSLVAVAYAAVLHFFAGEAALRPVLQDIAARLPADFDAQPVGVPLRWKLLGALPLINVITGVVVSGLSTNGRATLNDLGLDVVVAVIVAFTLSLELTLLVTKSILNPVGDLLRATERVKRGDLTARVPVVSGDEMGVLAASFNKMMQGLAEREALREAFGSYVDPEVAERVMQEGALLEGDDAEVSVLLVDIRDFTAFADRSSAREVVALLNDFFGLLVPLLLKHGGHANKFVGDGLLGVFGAPERMPDHADRALSAAADIAREVEREYGDRLRIGIGVNSGPVTAGSIGGGGRLEFTVIGDPVNVAARVEKVTKETGDVVLLTEATRCLLADPDSDDLEPRGAIPLRGKSAPVPIYALAPFAAAVEPTEAVGAE